MWSIGLHSLLLTSTSLRGQFGDNKCANTFVHLGKQIQPLATSQEHQETDSRYNRLTAITGARFADTPVSTSHCSPPMRSFRPTAGYVDAKLCGRPEKPPPFGFCV